MINHAFLIPITHWTSITMRNNDFRYTRINIKSYKREALSYINKEQSSQACYEYWYWVFKQWLSPFSALVNCILNHLQGSGFSSFCLSYIVKCCGVILGICWTGFWLLLSKCQFPEILWGHHMTHTASFAMTYT